MAIGSTKYTLGKKRGINYTFQEAAEGKQKNLKVVHYNFNELNGSLAYNASEKW